MEFSIMYAFLNSSTMKIESWMGKKNEETSDRVPYIVSLAIIGSLVTVIYLRYDAKKNWSMKD